MICDCPAMGPWGWTAMTFGWILVIGVLAWLVAWWVRGVRPSERSPMTLLDERFAQGEIESDEYLERRSTLEEAR